MCGADAINLPRIGLTIRLSWPEPLMLPESLPTAWSGSGPLQFYADALHIGDQTIPIVRQF